MAKTAMNQLEEQIEVIRKEAYTAGYAAAMQALCEFAGRSPNVGAAVVNRARKAAKTAKPRPHRTAATPRSKSQSTITAPKAQSATAATPKSARKARSKAQPPARTVRGSNALLITEVLKGTHGPTRAADIRKALQRDKHVAVSFTSIRHALGQLAKRGEVQVSADHREWRYVGNGAA